MILNLLLLFIAFIMMLLFVVGLILFLIGLSRHDRNNGFTKVGLIIGVIPASVVGISILFNIYSEIFYAKPDEKELIGEYQIVEVTQHNFDKNTYSQYKLQFYEGGTYTLTPTPDIDACESGNYNLNYNSRCNELFLRCSNSASSAHIVRELGNFKIEFIIGDPDSGESIYFEKIKK